MSTQWGLMRIGINTNYGQRSDPTQFKGLFSELIYNAIKDKIIRVRGPGRPMASCGF
ncbi:MAG: hypothetical protein ACI9CF_001560 [Candidatus Omnitrophota bacterium]|jgi:hypothetical protein